MATKWISTSSEDRRNWDELCPVNEFRVILPCSLSQIIPRPLIEKSDSAVLVSSGSLDGKVLYMASLNRVDFKDKAIDQEIFGIVFDTNVSSNGCFIHHGNWQGRTIKPPEDFWDTINIIGLGHIIDFGDLPNKRSGWSCEVNSSHQEAFSRLNNRFKEKSLL